MNSAAALVLDVPAVTLPASGITKPDEHAVFTIHTVECRDPLAARREPVDVRDAGRPWRAEDTGVYGAFHRDAARRPHSRDMQYGGESPTRHAALLAGGIARDAPAPADPWTTLKPDSDVEEVVRNFFIRQRVSWLD